MIGVLQHSFISSYKEEIITCSADANCKSFTQMLMFRAEDEKIKVNELNFTSIYYSNIVCYSSY